MVGKYPFTNDWKEIELIILMESIVIKNWKIPQKVYIFNIEEIKFFRLEFLNENDNIPQFLEIFTINIVN